MSQNPLPEQPDALSQRSGLQRAVAGLSLAVHASSERRDEWKPAVLDALETLQIALVRHAEFTESSDGLFAEVIEQAPRLANAVGHLEAEHEDLRRRIEGCAAAVHALDTGDSVADVSAEADELVRSFEMHSHRGAELVYEVYNVDISAGD